MKTKKGCGNFSKNGIKCGFGECCDSCEKIIDKWIEEWNNKPKNHSQQGCSHSWNDAILNCKYCNPTETDTSTLSDKIMSLGMSEKHKGKIVPISKIYAQDVKESIQRLKSNIEDLYLWEYNESVMKEIDKIFGNKLT